MPTTTDAPAAPDIALVTRLIADAYKQSADLAFRLDDARHTHMHRRCQHIRATLDKALAALRGEATND